MKISDSKLRLPVYTLADANAGEVVRLKNQRLYLIGINTETDQELLINLETGKTHVIRNAAHTECTAVDDARVEV